MPRIGFDKVYAAELLTDPMGGPATYGVPMWLGAGISAGVEHTSDSSILDADDHQTDIFINYGGTTVTLNVRELPVKSACMLQGHKLSATGGVIRSASDVAPYVALMFRCMKSDGTYQYCVLFKGKFQLAGSNAETKKKGGVTFQTPTLTADFIARDSDGQFEYYVDENENNASEIATWFTAVPTPAAAA